LRGEEQIESGSSNRNWELHITFQDGHDSVFNLQDLATRYQDESGGVHHFAESASDTLMQVQKASMPSLVLWNSNLTAPPVVNWAEIVDSNVANAPL
jgi:hypothetical protein